MGVSACDTESEGVSQLYSLFREAVLFGLSVELSLKHGIVKVTSKMLSVQHIVWVQHV